MFVMVMGCMLCASLMPVLGAALPYPSDTLFSLCELPCVAGIVPGETEFENVVETLSENFTTFTLETPPTQSNTPPIIFSTLLDNHTLQGTMVGRQIVRTMTFTHDFTLIQMLGILGTPDCIYHERIIDDVSTLVMVQWSFEADGVTASAFIDINSDNRWSPYADVGSFRLSVSDITCRSGRLEPRAWQGFPLFWRFRFED
jgi:hypothetical protein